jgi:leucyl aminopeptidase
VTQIRTITTNAAQASADVLVVAARVGGDERAARLLTASAALPPECAAQILAAFEAVAPRPITAPAAGAEPVRVTVSCVKAGSVIVCPVADTADHEALRRGIGAALRTLSGAGSVVVLPGGADDASVRAASEGALLGAYRFDTYRSQPSPALRRISVAVPEARARAGRALVKEARALIEAVNLTRDLVNTPPNDLFPQALVDAAKQLFADTSVTTKVWDDRALRRGRFGGLTAVGQGSAHGPRLVRAQYRHPRAGIHVALVGKGITFDSGGLSLKPPKSMEWMKSDMAGSAAVMATVRVVHDWGLPINVTGWLAVAENMPSGTAQRPGDVITMRGGKTVEVLNTDAEGRLVLADALVEAAGDEPDEIIDIATLTGAQLVALGSRVAGAMGNDDRLRDAVVEAGSIAGESLWPMPLPRELRPSLDSPVADLANIGDRNGGMLTAALFLQEFVPPHLPWVHLDIAGPSFNEGAPSGYIPKGGTGFGVRTLSEYLRLRSGSGRS